MSLTDTMYIGTSGLSAHGDALGIVGDNIANASTVGYKRDRAEFSDLLGGQIDGLQLGGGVKLDAPETMFDQGSITQTGNPLDVAIQGNGFFVVHGTHDGVTNDFYTRDGQFQLDNSGFVVDGNGLRLQGFATDAAGVQSAGMGDLQLGGRTTPAVATTSAKMTLNLDANDNTTAAAAFDPANPAATSQYSTSETVYDSLGNSHQVDVYFHADGNGQWDYHAMVDGGDLTGGTAGTQTEIASGSMQFDTNGVFQSQTANASSASFVGATPNQAIDFDFSTTTQTAQPSSVTSLDVDGNTAGTLTDIQISSDGKVSGTFSNGQEIQLAQLGLATFNSDNGLKRDSDNLFDATPDSGQAAIDVVGQGGRGSVMQGALEQSNVDLSTELVTMIAYQRAFEANSKTVTTADQMMQTVSQL